VTTRVRSARREQFCLFIAQGNTAVVAARKAGYSSPDKQAHQIMKQPAVKARIAEVSVLIDQEKAKDIVRVQAPTREWVLRELMDNVGTAKLASDRGAVNKGLELVGKEIGMFVQRSMQIESPLMKLPADKLLALLAIVEEAIGSDVASVAPAVTVASPALTIEHDPMHSVGSSVGTEEDEGATSQ
jgi:hypothetical protein